MQTLELEIKSVAEDGTFEGWAAVYQNIDSQGDRIVPGAFSSENGKQVPLLWAHKRDEVAGVGTLEDRAEGLFIKGRLLLDTTCGREAYARLKAGAARGLSVGFELLKHAREGAVRLIQAARMVEVSLTAFPANREALVTAVKAEEGETPFKALARILAAE